MCGRYTLTVDIEELAERFDCKIPNEIMEPRYNVAPSQIMPVVVKLNGERKLQKIQWGLVPFWAKDRKIGNKLINARIETLGEKASFKYAVKERRCIIPADGYYEWQNTSKGKFPLRIVMPNHQLFSMAGLWEKWNSPDGKSIMSFTIITAPPIPSLAHIHNRMPLILNREQEHYWLDGSFKLKDLGEIQYFLSKIRPIEQLNAYPVSNRVNNPKFDDVKCIEPANNY